MGHYAARGDQTLCELVSPFWPDRMTPSPVVSDAEGRRFIVDEKDCPTCGPSCQRFVGYRGGRYQRYGRGIVSRIVRCTTCGLMFPNPFPVPEDPQELYGDPDEYFRSHDEAKKVEHYRYLMKEAMRRSPSEQPSLLDVGSGRGEALKAAESEGVGDAVGLELSDAMVQYARDRFGLTVARQTIEEHAAATDATYDIVILNAVLEHVYDPDSMIAAVRKLTHEQSVLYIDTPNEPHLLSYLGNGINRLLRREAVFNLSPTWPPYHVFGFNPRALKVLLGKHGFQVAESKIWASPHIAARKGDHSDHLKAFVASQVRKVGNWTGTASNMTVWAFRDGESRGSE